MEEINWIKNHLVTFATLITASATIIGFIHKFLKQFHSQRQQQMDQAQLEMELLKKELEGVKEELKFRKEYIENQGEMNLAILHDLILERCKIYIAQKWVGINALASLKRLYASYVKFEGNGIIKSLMDEVEKLEKRQIEV